MVDMTRGEYKDLRKSVKDLTEYFMTAKNYSLYNTDKELYSEYYRFVSVYELWLKEVIEYNEDYELCLAIKNMIQLKRMFEYKSAVYSKLGDDGEILENLEMIELMAHENSTTDEH
jgi:hypothetical protein